MYPKQLTAAADAIARIPDGAVISFNGIGMIGLAEQFFYEIEKRFLSEGHPQNMTLYSACGLGGANHEIQCLIHPGMFAGIMVGYIYPYADFMPAIQAEEIDAFNLPQGIISTNYREAAAGRPGFYSKIGLHTFADPRQEGCALNARSAKKVPDLVELQTIRGEEYLFYHTVFPDICILRGTTADPYGNITMEHEVNVADALSIAMAVHNHGGRVMVQVERLSDTAAHPQSVIVPGALVDDIWVSPNQVQTNLPGYNPYYSGEIRAPQEMLDQMCLENLTRDRRPGVPITITERIIARRAALELKDHYMINLGIGTPMLIASEAKQMGLLTPQHHLSIETGVMGGIPVPDAFGAVINAEAIYPMASQFDFYEGGGLDAAFVGAIEIDRQGNVNVIRKDDVLIGVGGFHHVTQAAKKIVICSKFRVSSGYALSNGTVTLLEGRADKFVNEIECIALNAPYFRSLGKKLIYITERAVFELDDDGFVMTEVAPGLHPYFSVLIHLPFPVKVHPRLAPMPSACFAFDMHA